MYEHVIALTGLNPSESRVYETLLVHGPQGGGALVQQLRPMKRGLIYKTLNTLIARSLVLKEQRDGAAIFYPQSPDTLLRFSEERERAAIQATTSITSILPELKAKYVLSTERPAIRFFEGIAGLKSIYEEKLRATGVRYLIRSGVAEVYRQHFGSWFTRYLKRQSEMGIETIALTPDDPDAAHDPAIDEARRVVRTWIRTEDYTAPVEIDIYEQTVAIIVFGKEIFGITLESALLAKAFIEIFHLVEHGAKSRPVSHDHH